MCPAPGVFRVPTPPRQASPIETLATLTFGAGGNSLPHQRRGFGDPEDGFTWSMGEGSELTLTIPPPSADTAGEHLLELRLDPFVETGLLESQRLLVSANSVQIGDDQLIGEGTVGYRIPARILRPDGRLTISLRHPEAASPISLGLSDDNRVLGFMIHTIAVLHLPASPSVSITALPPLRIPAPKDLMGAAVTAATGLDPRALVLCFESLGHNCEFGLVQEHVGADPLGMLRFGSITLEDLLAGLRLGFAGMGDNIIVGTWPTADGRLEYMVRDKSYDIGGVHTFQTTDETTEAEVRETHGNRLRFMRRRFTHWLRSGQRIFVFQRPGQITLSQARPLLTLLRSFGPNALLYVDQSPDLPCGAVEQLDYGLFHGKLDYMAPASEAGLMDLPSWLSICVNAWRLWQAGRAT